MSFDTLDGRPLASEYWRQAVQADPAIGPALSGAPDEAELRLFADHLPTLCWIANGDGHIVWYNRPWHAYCGTTPAQMEGWGWQSVHDPENLPEVLMQWRASIASGEAFEMTFPLRGADGIFRPFLTRVRAIRGPDGTVLRWFGTNTDVSALAQAKAARVQSESHLRLLLDSSAEAFYALDRDGTTTLCNAAFLRVMGFARESDVLGRKLHALIHHSHPDGAPYDAASCPINACALHGTTAHVSDEYFYRADGTPLPVEYWARPIVVDGEHRGAICTFFDISERRAAEAARLAGEASLRALNADLERQVVERSSERGTTWQISPLLLSVIDLQTGRFTRVNPAWTALLGWTETELTGQAFVHFLHPEDQPAIAPAWALVQAGKPLLNHENRYRAADGTYRWLSWVCVPEGGKLYSTARDTTRERAQAALVEERTRERDLLWNTSQDLLVVADYAGKLLRINPSWMRVFGFPEDTLRAGTWTALTHPDDQPAVRDLLAGMRATGNPVRFESRVRTQAGLWRRIAWTLSPGHGGRELTGVGRDVTDQRETEERLRQSQKMEAVGQLTGGLAHDFNNLLTGISGSLEIMQLRLVCGDGASVDRYIAAAMGAVRRAAALTHRMLAFSRRQTLDPKVTDVNRLVGGMEELIRRTAGPHVAIEVVEAPGLWPVLVDPNQLENALLNLCINARDAMVGGGRITIATANTVLDAKAACQHELPAGPYVTLRVTDTGTGMTPDVIARAFDPFFTTKPIGEGTGLGLSMIYGFARQSGGQVRIASQAGQGTTMCLYLPRDMSGAQEEQPPALPEPVVAEGRGEVVLVVDDEPTVRMLICEVLAEFGYVARDAPDGPSALRILQSDARIDLLVTDVGLPGGLNGRQMADAARVGRPDLQVLFITGYAENAVMGSLHLDAGMQVLKKPFKMEALAERVRSMIGSRPEERT